MLRHTDALVVGAGPVGMFTALLLAERKVNVFIIDKLRTQSTHSYALALHPETLHLLQNVGLGDKVNVRGYHVDRIRFYQGHEPSGEVILGKLDSRFPYALVLSQSDLEWLLQERLAEMGVQIHWSHELAEIGMGYEGLPIARIERYEDVPQGYPILDMQRLVVKTISMEAKYIVGADGFHSRTARFLQTAYKRPTAARYYSVYEFHRTNELNHELRVVNHEGKFSVLWPMPNDCCRWTFEIDSPDEHDASVDRLKELSSERAPWFKDFPSEVQWAACTRFESRVAESFGNGRVWLVGDSAHLTEPFAAQSMNFGMREAHELSWRIFEILRNGGDTALMESYETHAKDEWEPLVQQEGLRVSGFSPEWVRTCPQRIAACLPASGEELEDLMAQVGLEKL